MTRLEYQSVPSNTILPTLSLPNCLQAIDTNRSLSQSRYAESMPKSFTRNGDIVVRYGSMRCRPVIPQRNRLVIPFETDLQVLPRRDVLFMIRRCPKISCSHEATCWKLTVNNNFKSASLSSSFNPSILFVNPGLINNAFSPVTGWTRTMGCFEITGALLTCLPSLTASSACGNPECSALNPSSNLWIGSESRS